MEGSIHKKRKICVGILFVIFRFLGMNHMRYYFGMKNTLVAQTFYLVILLTLSKKVEKKQVFMGKKLYSELTEVLHLNLFSRIFLFSFYLPLLFRRKENWKSVRTTLF